MLTRLVIKLTLLTALLLGLFTGAVACDTGAAEYDLQMLRGALTLSPAVIRVEQHREVILNFESDAVGTIRVDKLDTEIQLDPTKTVPLNITVTKVGRFPVTWQAQGDTTVKEIAFLDVRPASP